MKRFTETNKWADPWFRKLGHQAKLLWFYLVDHCDNIGLVEIDFALASADCGTKITTDHLAELKDRVQVLDDGKIFLPKFITFQYGSLSENCAPHKKVIEAVRFHSLTQTFKGYAYPSVRVTDTLSVRANNKEEEKDKEEERKKINRARGTFDEVLEFCRESGLFPRDAEYLWNKWESNGWQNGGKAMKDWRATVRAWKAQGYLPSQKSPSPADVWPAVTVADIDCMTAEERIKHYQKDYPESDWPFIQEDGFLDLMAKMEHHRAAREAAEREAAGEPPETTEGEPELW